jgi:hypothetical protein
VSVLNWVANSVVFLIFFLAKKGERGQNQIHGYYGNMGCQVSKEGIKHKEGFLSKIKIILKVKYYIL